MNELLHEHGLTCPYCGEPITLLADCSGGDQDYIEDCPVCCQPIQLALTVTEQGLFDTLTARRDSE